ncbi:MAG TPA: hypothetical protein VGN35_10595 [Jatrophihabitantaceae bacterium]|jgi:hypothetical protein|nr:hypothetical protein [Jatrophihabitantaceae bacterium]
MDEHSLPRVRGGLLALALSTAAFGALTAGATGAHARTPPFHCKQSPQGQDCTNGGDGTGGSWSPPASYIFLASSGTWDEYQRSDNLDATNMDASTVQSAAGYTHCETGVRVPGSTVSVVCH